MLSAAKHLVAGWGIRRGSALANWAFVATAVLAIAIVGLAFPLWVTSRVYHRFDGWDVSYLHGTDVHGVTSFGDGYLVASLATVAAVVAIGAIRWPIAERPSAALIAVVGFTSFGTALYDVVHEWGYYDFGPLWGNYFDPHLDLTDTGPALWATLALSAVLGLAGTALSLAMNTRPHDAPPVYPADAWTLT